MSVFPPVIPCAPISEYAAGNWQIKSLGYEAAFPLDMSLYRANTGNPEIDRQYWFDVDHVVTSKYKHLFALPSGFYLDGIYRGCDMFVQVSCNRKPSSKQLKKVRSIILTGLESAHQQELRDFLESIEEE